MSILFIFRKFLLVVFYYDTFHHALGINGIHLNFKDKNMITIVSPSAIGNTSQIAFGPNRIGIINNRGMKIIKLRNKLIIIAIRIIPID